MAESIGRYIGKCAERYGISQLLMLFELPKDLMKRATISAGDYLNSPQEGKDEPMNYEGAIKAYGIAEDTSKILGVLRTAVQHKANIYVVKAVNEIERLIERHPDMDISEYKNEMKTLIEVGEQALKDVDTDNCIYLWEIAEKYNFLDIERKKVLKTIKLIVEDRRKYEMHPPELEKELEELMKQKK